MLPIDQLADFEAQPFKVFDDDSMQELAESIRSVGVLVPIIVRRMENGRYEIISGHRRKRACENYGRYWISVMRVTVHKTIVGRHL